MTHRVELARANGIKVVIASITPVNDCVRPNMTTTHPTEKIEALHTWTKPYAQGEHRVLLNYHPALLDADRLLKKTFSDDGRHPNSAVYAVTAPLAQRAIDQASMH